jgi:hypothetical protein
MFSYKSFVFPFGWQYSAHTKSRRELIYYRTRTLLRPAMYAYHPEYRSPSDGSWTAQNCMCLNSCLLLEKQLTEL